MVKENNAGKTLGILAICLGWFIPLVGLILGIIGLNKSVAGTNARTLNTIGIVESILFWIIYIFVLL